MDLLRNYEEKVEKPSAYHILEHFYYHKNVTSGDVWNNQHHYKIRKNRFDVKTAWKMAQAHAKQPYADVHCHVFTDTSFQEMIKTLIELGKIKFSLLYSGSTVYHGNEFHVLLQKPKQAAGA